MSKLIKAKIFFFVGVFIFMPLMMYLYGTEYLNDFGRDFYFGWIKLAYVFITPIGLFALSIKEYEW